MEIGKSNWKPYAGEHCYPPHEPPPGSICSGELCQEWLVSVSAYQQCDSLHAHRDHHDLAPTARGTNVTFCPGREFCDPKYMEH